MSAFDPNQSLSDRPYSERTAYIDYYGRGRLIWTANYGSMCAAKPSLRPTFEFHHRDSIDRAVLRDCEGNVRRILPERPSIRFPPRADTSRTSDFDLADTSSR